MFSGITGVAQKKGSAEAASAGSKSVVVALVPILIVYHNSLLFVKFIKMYFFYL
jgi:hypothetical protein